MIHFLCGFGICYVFYDFGWWWSLAAVALAAGAKELVWDMSMKKGTPEVVDFFSTIAAFPVVVLIETLKGLII